MNLNRTNEETGCTPTHKSSVVDARTPAAAVWDCLDVLERIVAEAVRASAGRTINGDQPSTWGALRQVNRVFRAAADSRVVLQAFLGVAPQLLPDPQAGLRFCKQHQNLKRGRCTLIEVADFAAWSHDGARVLTASRGAARLWNLQATSSTSVALQEDGSLIEGMGFSSDGTHAYANLADDTARVWDLRVVPPASLSFRRHGDQVLALGPGGNHVLVQTWQDCAVWLWDVRTAPPTKVDLQAGVLSIIAASFSPDGKQALTRRPINTVRLWNLQVSPPSAQVLEEHADHDKLEFSCDGTRVLTTNWQSGIVRVWNLRTLPPTNTSFQASPHSKACLLPDATQALSYGAFGNKLWDLQTSSPLSTSFEKYVPLACFSIHGVLATVNDGYTSLFDLSASRLQGKLIGGSCDTVVAKLNASDGSARQWGPNSSCPQGFPFIVHRKSALRAMFSPDGSRLLVDFGGRPHEGVRIFDFSAGRVPSQSHLSSNQMVASEKGSVP